MVDTVDEFSDNTSNAINESQLLYIGHVHHVMSAAVESDTVRNVTCTIHRNTTHMSRLHYILYTHLQYAPPPRLNCGLLPLLSPLIR